MYYNFCRLNLEQKLLFGFLKLNNSCYQLLYEVSICYCHIFRHEINEILI